MRTSKSFWEMADDFNKKHYTSKVKFTDAIPQHKRIIERLITDNDFAEDIYKQYFKK